MVSVNEAKKLIHSQLYAPATTHVGLENSRGRFLSEDVFADRDYPPFNRAAVDGYAVRHGDMESGLKTFHVAAEIFSGEGFDHDVEPGRCIKIMTGAAMPEGFDVLFKVEHCEVLDSVVAIPEEEAAPGLNISRRGENARKGDVILGRGTRIDERTVHALAAVGLHSTPVFSLPEVHIISTGNEIIPVDQQPAPFQIRDSNYYGLLFGLLKFNIKPASYQLLGDEREQIRAGISAGLSGDILIISGGVSMGDRDFVPGVLAECGVEKVFHKVDIKPGKPLWFGRRHDKKTGKTTFVFALPGNPFSTLVTYKVFIEPWLLASFGGQEQKPVVMPLFKEKVFKEKRLEFFPVKVISKAGEGSFLDPVRFAGSGDITATAGSDGLAFYQGEKRELYKGDLAEFIPWN